MPPTEGLVHPTDDEKAEVTSPTPTLFSGAGQEQNDQVTVETSTDKDDEDEHSKHYVTGFKLFSMMASITIAAFLMLLDISIIATVGRPVH